MGVWGWRHRDGDWDGKAAMGGKRWRQGWGCRDGGRVEDRDGGTGIGAGMGAGMGAQG